jgi:hypothetical protein
VCKAGAAQGSQAAVKGHVPGSASPQPHPGAPPREGSRATHNTHAERTARTHNANTKYKGTHTYSRSLTLTLTHKRKRRHTGTHAATASHSHTGTQAHRHTQRLQSATQQRHPPRGGVRAVGKHVSVGAPHDQRAQGFVQHWGSPHRRREEGIGALLQGQAAQLSHNGLHCGAAVAGAAGLPARQG